MRGVKPPLLDLEEEMEKDQTQRAVKGGGINKSAKESMKGTLLSAKTGFVRGDEAKKPPSTVFKQEKAGYDKSRRDSSADGEKQLKTKGEVMKYGQGKKEKRPSEMSSYEGVEVLTKASKGLPSK